MIDYIKGLEELLTLVKELLSKLDSIRYLRAVDSHEKEELIDKLVLLSKKITQLTLQIEVLTNELDLYRNRLDAP